MSYEQSIQRYRSWYAKLLRLYSKPHYERFGEGMEQTFNDLLRERAEAQRGLSGWALWMFAETSVGIVKGNMASIMTQHKNIARIAMATGSLLLVPLLAMQFTDEVVWDLADFAVAGVLLFGAGLTYELVARRMGSIAYRVAVGVAVAAALFLVWMNLAVGLIGSENNPANLMYFGVLAVGIIGAIIARFRPRGMAYTLLAMAIAQALVPVMALVIWRPEVNSVSGFWGAANMSGVMGVNAFFVLLFLGSAGLFRKSAREQTPAGTGPQG